MKIHHFILGLMLLPFYPLIKRRQGQNEKIQVGERVVVVTRDERGKMKIIK